jgi:poly(3-hydroxyalkanoate) synthetase
MFPGQGQGQGQAKAQGHRPAPGRRLGPRPLAMHLALARMRRGASKSGSAAWNDAWTSWLQNPAGVAAASCLHDELAADRALIAGIAAYRRHPATRDVIDPLALWTDGSSMLRDYGGAGRVLMLVPSLVNRGTILDLTANHSMARFLAAQGFRVLLLDWGWPGPEERLMGMEALIVRRLLPAVAAARSCSAGPVVLAGYCMGGLFALAAALACPADLAGLALLATPWDFHAEAAELGRIADQLLQALEPLMALTGTVPVDALQCLFSVADPHGVGDKYRQFAALDQDSERARRFVLLEDWLADGVPLAAPVARECLGGWYGANAPARLAWRIAGQVVDPASLAVPCFVAVPGRDRIVPPESALALARSLPEPMILRPRAGHVGMVAGAGAEAALWRPLADWATRL